MCFSCARGTWPWAHTVQLAPGPVKDETIYLDANPGFYPDYRTAKELLSTSRIVAKAIVLSSYMAPYYTYKDPVPSTKRNPHDPDFENPKDWPKVYRHKTTNANQVANQGMHLPAPVYTSDQPTEYSWYYGQQATPAATGYYYNGTWIPNPCAAAAGTLIPSSSLYHNPLTTAPTTDTGKYWRNFYNNVYQQAYKELPPNQYIHGSITPFGVTQYNAYSQYPHLGAASYGGYPMMAGVGMPSAFPTATCPATMTAQAAAVAAANAALAAMPQAPTYFPGSSPADIAAQQAMMAQMGYGGNPAAWTMMMNGMQKPPPTQLAPYKPAEGQQFWCKELDGSWTLRTQGDITQGEVSPGHWERHPSSGYFYWVREKVV